MWFNSFKEFILLFFPDLHRLLFLSLLTWKYIRTVYLLEISKNERFEFRLRLFLLYSEKSRCLTLALRVKKSSGRAVNLTFWTVKYTYKNGGLISAWRGLKGGVCFALLPALTQRSTCTLTLPPGWKKQWVCVQGEALTCLRIASTGEGKSRGGKLKSTYSRWTLLSTKGTEGDAFCPHGRYFTKLQEERRAQFNWEIGESAFQLYCSETLASSVFW